MRTVAGERLARRNVKGTRVADHPATGSPGAKVEEGEVEVAGPQGVAPTAGSVHPRVHDHTQEAELRPPEGCSSPPHLCSRSHCLYPRYRPQPAGALDRARSRGPRERPPGRPLQDRPSRARHRRGPRPRPVAFEVRREERRRWYLMPRKGPAPGRVLLPDPVYSSLLVTQIQNRILVRGKRTLAEGIVYDALTKVADKTGKDPLQILKKGIDNIKPLLEVRSRRVGGSTYQVPVEVTSRRGSTLAIRWLVTFSRKRRERSMADRLAGEILDASGGTGSAVKRREDMHKMAEANKAFAHYRW